VTKSLNNKGDIFAGQQHVTARCGDCIIFVGGVEERRETSQNPIRAVDNLPITTDNNLTGVTMVKIRLRRVGAKNRPSYRVVVTDSRAPRDGAYIEKIGLYNPLTEPETVVIEEEKALNWLRQGAQPTEAVARLLSKLGITEKFKAEKEVATDRG
jgi:small subunit ribosomal protein S16